MNEFIKYLLKEQTNMISFNTFYEMLTEYFKYPKNSIDVPFDFYEMTIFKNQKEMIDDFIYFVETKLPTILNIKEIDDETLFDKNIFISGLEQIINKFEIVDFRKLKSQPYDPRDPRYDNRPEDALEEVESNIHEQLINIIKNILN